MTARVGLFGSRWGTVSGLTTITTTNITVPQTNVSGLYRLVYP
ncbi:MAG: hypothetical protein RLY20_2116 [Verrucomicrobiota bacterium]|jgi:hypothetical protein